MEEKRKTARVEKPLIVQYAQSAVVLLRWDSTTIKNISQEGVLFNTNKTLVKSEKLHLRFTIPTDPFNRLEIEGEVVESFVQGHGTRIKFIDLSEQQKKVLCDYVDYTLKLKK